MQQQHRGLDPLLQVIGFIANHIHEDAPGHVDEFLTPLKFGFFPTSIYHDIGLSSAQHRKMLWLQYPFVKHTEIILWPKN